MSKKTPVVEDWVEHQFSTGPYAGKDYIGFQRAAKRDLKKAAQSAGFTLHKFLPNHYCFSAVLRHQEDTEIFAYVSVSDVRIGSNRWYEQVLYRTMKHEKDWTGGHNQWCRWDELAQALAGLFQRTPAYELDTGYDHTAASHLSHAG